MSTLVKYVLPFKDCDISYPMLLEKKQDFETIT